MTNHFPAATTTQTSSERAVLSYMLNRRRFLTMLGSAGALGAVGCASASTQTPASRSAASAADAAAEEIAPGASAPPRRQANGSRQLVVIEMQGGNDGLAMLQPFESGLLQDRRPNLVSADEELIDAGSGFGWHPNLAGLAGLGLAAGVGVGSNVPDFSHFEMEQRWWRGDSSDSSRLATGFFGRLCDQLDAGAPVTGLSLSGGPTPALTSEKAVTVGLTDPGVSWFFQQDDPWFDMLRQTVGAMAVPSPGDDQRFAAARSGLDDTLRFAESLAEIPDGDNEKYPWSDLGQQLRFAAEVLALDVGVRVLHVRQGGFDTHTGQQWRHAQLMAELNDATVAFVDDLKQRGHFEDTLIVTTSEFGRRVPVNDGGTDHGGASTVMVCGPGAKGVHGEAPNLAKLDDDNVVATARFEDYYATIADHWFDVDPAEVLPKGATPIAGLI